MQLNLDLHSTSTIRMTSNYLIGVRNGQLQFGNNPSIKKNEQRSF